MKSSVKKTAITILTMMVVLVLTVLPSFATDASKEYKETAFYDCDTDGTGGSVEIIGSSLSGYTGYYRHRGGKLITEASQMELLTTASGSKIKMSLSGLLDYEDWKVSVSYRYTWIETVSAADGSIIKIPRSRTGTHVFKGTTEKDDTVSDQYELREKIRKYGKVKLSSNISITGGEGAVCIDGNTSTWKSTADHFGTVTVDGADKTIASAGIVFEVKNDTAFVLDNAGLESSQTGIVISKGSARISKTDIKGNETGIRVDRGGELIFKDGIIVSDSGSCIESKSEKGLDIEDASLKGRTGIDNNGKGLHSIAGEVIRMPKVRGGLPTVDKGKVDTGIGSIALKNVSIRAENLGIDNTGTVTVTGACEISAATGISNMGNIDIAAGSFDVTGDNTGIDNGSWLHIIIDVLGEKDSTYTYKERYNMAIGIYYDMCSYACSGAIIRIGGSGACNIKGGTTGISNGGTVVINNPSTKVKGGDDCIGNTGILEMHGGHIGGGSCGVDNSGSFSQSGGIVTGNSAYGVYQKGKYYMSGSASVGSDNVIHLATGRIINVTSSISRTEAGIISLSEGDLKLGRTVIDATSCDEKEADRLAGDSANGVMPEGGKFRLAFKYVSGHPAALRSGKGEGYNGKKKTVILSALFSAEYLCVMDTPLNDMTFKVPDRTYYFWKEKARFSTGSDTQRASRVRVLYKGRDITATFRQTGWRDDQGIYGKKDIERVYDGDHSFTAMWDLACGLYFHGNNDTREDGSKAKGIKDYRIKSAGLGYKMPGNSSQGYPGTKDMGYFLREEPMADEGSGYTQRYSFDGWSLYKLSQYESEVYSPGYEFRDMSVLYDALRMDNITYEDCGDEGYRAIVHFYVVWNAFPHIKAKDVYIYDRQLSDEKHLRKLIASQALPEALDKEDGNIDEDAIILCSDLSQRVFEPSSLKDRGNMGGVPLYYAVSDSNGNEAVCRIMAYIVSGDDEDRYTDKALYANELNPSGTSPLSEDATPMYIRYIDKLYTKTLDERSKWRQPSERDLLEKAFAGDSSETYNYSHEELVSLRKMIGDGTDGMRNEDIIRLLGYTGAALDSEKVEELDVDIREGLSSLEVSWDGSLEADVARITYIGENGGILEVPAKEGFIVLTGLGEGCCYKVEVSLLRSGTVIAEGSRKAVTLSLKAPGIRVQCQGRKESGTASIYYTLSEDAAYYEIQRQKKREEGFDGWAMVATIDASEAKPVGLSGGCDKNEACYKDSITAGIYRYRIRAIGYSLGAKDIRMTYQSPFALSSEIGYVSAPEIKRTRGGVDSLYLSWKLVPEADGYIVSWKKSGSDPYDKEFGSDVNEAVITSHIKGGTKYKIYVRAYIKGESRYISETSDQSAVYVQMLERPKVDLDPDDGLIAVSFDVCEGAKAYTIQRRRLPVRDETAMESIHTEHTYGEFKKQPGVYEYRVIAEGERLDGKKVKNASKWSPF